MQGTGVGKQERGMAPRARQEGLHSSSYQWGFHFVLGFDWLVGCFFFSNGLQMIRSYSWKSEPTQTEPAKKDVSVQTPSWKECLSPSAAPGATAKDTCMWCEQVNDL